MKIKSLELVGFKSFSEKTVINFSEGVTAIVGPNGSGKSNVVDAMRWLMGETAPTMIRTKLLEDIIFSGSASAPPMGMAEVNLIFDNSEGPSPAGYKNFSEIQVTRRAYRDGESEFFINKTPCRLKDIVELSLDTGSGARGYCIIEQSKVQQIITGKPEETRMLIEEAAGVAKYRMRKKEALRKLETTRQNLARVSDILLEVKRQLGSIDRQARKAKKYKELKAAMRDFEIELMRRRAVMEMEAEGHLNVSLQDLLLNVKRDEENIQSVKVREQEIRNRIFCVETEIDTQRGELSSSSESFYRLDTEYEGVNKDLKEIEERERALLDEGKKLEGELEEIDEKKIMLQGSIEEADVKFTHFAKEPVSHSGQIEGDGKKLAELKEIQERKRDELVDLLSKTGGLDNSTNINEKWILETERKKRHLSRELEQIRGEIEQVEGKMRDEVEREKTLTAAMYSVSEDFQKVNIEISHSERETEILEESIGSSRKERERVESRLMALQQINEKYELFGESVSYIMNEFRSTDDGSNILGVLGDLIDVENGYEKAVEAALGESLKYIIVKDAQDGVIALRALKDSGKGRGSFAPVKLRRKGPKTIEVPAGDGVISSISGIISAPSECRELIEDLLGDVLLVNTVEDAVRLWKTNGFWATYVTVEGDLVLPSGIISGGRMEGSELGVLSTKRELAELGNKLLSIEKDMAMKEKQLERFKSDIEERKRSYRELREKIDSHEKEKHSVKISIEYLEKELGKHKKRMKWSEEELSHLTAEGERYVKQNEENRSLLSEASEKAAVLEREITGLKEEILRRETDLRELKERTGKREVERIELMEKRNRLESELASLSRIYEDKSGYRGKIFEEASELDDKKRVLTGLKEEMVEKLKNLADVRENLERSIGEKVTIISGYKEDLEKVEKEVAHHSSSIEDTREGISSLRERLAAVKTRSENIQSIARDSYGLERIDQYPGEEELIDLHDDALAEKVNMAKKQLDSIGEVNVSAIEEREELADRYDHLLRQKGDLEKSMNDLERVISKIDRESRDRFISMFNHINEKFIELFPKLFIGGRGQLKLTDENNLLESGVEIIPQPPGKKLKNLSLLSNGEKALTGICLLLSLFFVRPGPFLFLDEVDAPLDEANVDRFNKLIREISGRCQVIMITHKKRTMELADYLYGTTMDRPGISRIVSAQLS